VGKKTLKNCCESKAKKNVDDLKVIGDGDLFQLLSKAYSEAEGWMKSTKAMEIVGSGCVVQVTTQQGDNVAEALTFVPDVMITQDEDGNNILIPTGMMDVKESLDRMFDHISLMDNVNKLCDGCQEGCDECCPVECDDTECEHECCQEEEFEAFLVIQEKIGDTDKNLVCLNKNKQLYMYKDIDSALRKARKLNKKHKTNSFFVVGMSLQDAVGSRFNAG